MSLLLSSPGRTFLIATILLASSALPLLPPQDVDGDEEGARAVVGEEVRFEVEVEVDDIPRFRSVLILRSLPISAHPPSSGPGLRTHLPPLVILLHPLTVKDKGKVRRHPRSALEGRRSEMGKQKPPPPPLRLRTKPNTGRTEMRTYICLRERLLQTRRLRVITLILDHPKGGL